MATKAKARQITDKERENLMICLNMRTNYIETGDISYSASDIERMGKDCDMKVKALTVEQMKLLIEIEEFKKLILKKRVFVVEERNSQ